jgi:hypothetical protein
MGHWGPSACIDDHYLVALAVLRFSADISSCFPSSGSSVADKDESVFALVAGGQCARPNGVAGTGGVVKVWKCSMQQQHQQQQQQQQQHRQQKQHLEKKSLRRFVKEASKLKRKEASDPFQVHVERDPLACFLIPLLATDLHFTSTLPSSSSHPPALTHSLLLHVCSSRSFRTLNLTPTPTPQRVQRLHFVVGADSHTSLSCNSSAPQMSSYFDAVLSPLVRVLVVI